MASTGNVVESGGVSVVRPRLDGKPWGGRRLERFGLDLPAGAMIGEALVTAGEAEITAGTGEGRTLGETVADDPDRLLGAIARAAVGGRAIFPLLVKLIDARENLSIQVHPDDAQAASRDRLGKTEAWHVLAAEPGACLYLGLRPGVSVEAFREAALRLDGSSAPLLRRVPALPGTTVLIPAGTVHALGAGVLVYEIQQPSDVTFRIDDWGRVDAQGNPREMHLDEGFGVLQPESRPELIAPLELPERAGRRHLLAACRFFALERVALVGGGRWTLPASSGPQVLTVLEGGATIGTERLAAGSSAVVWPGGAAEMDASVPTVVLRGWVPDLAREMREAVPMAGTDADVAGLSGSMTDVRDALDG